MALQNAQTNQCGGHRSGYGLSARQSAQVLRCSPKPKYCVATLVDITPDEPRAVFGDAVHQCKIVREIRHTRILNLLSNAADQR